MFGYQGLWFCSNIHLQSGTFFSATQVGHPNAPAKWAVPVSEVIIKSQFIIIAAVSSNAFSPASKSLPNIVNSKLISLIWFSPSPLWRLISSIFVKLDISLNNVRGKDLPKSILFLLPCQHIPTLKVSFVKRLNHDLTFLWSAEGKSSLKV